MKKTIKTPVIIMNKGIASVQIHVESDEDDLRENEDPELQNVFDDLGEIEDLNEIYGEMSII